MTPDPALEEMIAEPAPMSELGRLAGVFFSPGQAFADIAKRPRWIVPLLLSMVVATVFLYLYSTHVGWEKLFQDANAQSSQFGNLTAAQRAQAERVQLQVAKYGAWVSGLLVPVLVTVVIGGILQFLTNTVMGGGIAFKNTLAAVSYGNLPGLIKTGLSILVMFLKPSDEFDLRNPLMTNAAALLPADSARWMQALGASLDVFTFWSMALTSIGIAAAARRMSTGKAFGMILFPWALYVILTVGAAAAFSR